MYFIHDPDEWETVVNYESYGEFAGHPMGSFTMGQRRRSPEEVASIKARKQLEADRETLAAAGAALERMAARRGESDFVWARRLAADLAQFRD